MKIEMKGEADRTNDLVSSLICNMSLSTLSLFGQEVYMHRWVVMSYIYSITYTFWTKFY